MVTFPTAHLCTLNKMADWCGMVQGPMGCLNYDVIMLIIHVCFKCAVFQSEIKLVTHCYIRLPYLRIIHLILQAASGPSIICDFL